LRLSQPKIVCLLTEIVVTSNTFFFKRSLTKTCSITFR
jgi:hypothetical protein